MYASRNLLKCTKDCLCLFVCPTGATDTESGQIDSSRCLDGCRLCVDACPSKAIYLVMESYPEPPEKDPRLSEKMMELCLSKYNQEKAAANIVATAGSEAEKRFAQALRRSLRILGEDCARESGFMLPQAAKTRELLKELNI